jgi:ribose 5-phosphate isomerase B
MKMQLAEHLRQAHPSLDVTDMGCPDTSSVDYPDIAAAVCAKVIAAGEGARGLLVCGSGIGISISANKVKGIRCALCHDNYTAKFARLHNDAQVVALGGRTTGIEVAKDICDVFFGTEFEGGRHARRVGKIMNIEGGCGGEC